MRWWVAPALARVRRNSGRPSWAPLLGWAGPGDGDGDGAGEPWSLTEKGRERGWTCARSAWDAAGCSPSARARSARTASRSRPWPARQAGWRARSAGTTGAARRNAPRPAARRTWRGSRRRDRGPPGPAAIQASGLGRHRARIGYARGMRRPLRVLRAREEPFKKPLLSATAGAVRCVGAVWWYLPVPSPGGLHCVFAVLPYPSTHC